ncbi:MAG: DUF4271 domain-containing protein [Bacteroidia bacterium]|nr:DUF4271 domain-containing protein [Bacteroidia bacterium]
MSFKRIFLSIFLLCALVNLNAQNEIVSILPNDSINNINIDSTIKVSSTFSLLDSLKNERILLSIFNPTLKLHGLTNTIGLKELSSQRELPFLKQIKPIYVNNNNWKIWFILSLILYIAIIRLISPRKFEEAAFLVFDMFFLTTVNGFKDAKFSWISVHLFIIYILSFSLILNHFFEFNQILNEFDYKILVWIIAGSIAVIYLIKFLIYFLVGFLLNDMISSTKMIINTIQISSFLSFVLLLFSIFYIYLNGLQLTQTIFFAMVAIFFTAIIYRIVRYLLNQISNSTLPFFYLFIYLCALEISPWLIFIKILNSYLS